MNPTQTHKTTQQIGFKIIMADMFIFVSQRLVVFNRTAGDNSRVSFGKVYPLETGGSVVFTVNDDGSVRVRRNSQDNVLVYEKDITESGMYVINPSFIRTLPASPKVMRVLHNRVRDHASQFKVQITETDKVESFRLSMYIKKNGFVREPKFVVYVNPNELTFEDVDSIVELFNNMKEVDMDVLIYRLDFFKHDGALVKVDSKFFKTYKILADRYYMTEENAQ